MAADPAKPATALLMPDFAKADLFKGVVLGGVLPRKTFSMAMPRKNVTIMNAAV